MIENTRSIDRTATLILVTGMAFVVFPLIFVIITATQSYDDFLRHNFSLRPGSNFWANVQLVYEKTMLFRQTFNSIVVSLIVAGGKCLLAFTTAYAVVFFSARYRMLIFAAILASIMLPLELKVITAYQVAANVAMPVNAFFDVTGLNALSGWLFDTQLRFELNLLNSYAGIALPLLAQGTGTLILRQYFLTLPQDLAKAATMDGAGPMRFMRDILLPLSLAPLISLFIYFFIGAWTQYMWPLVAASSPDMQTAVVGLARLKPGVEDEIPNFPLLMTGAIIVSLSPLVLIAVMQRHIVRGLTMSEK